MTIFWIKNGFKLQTVNNGRPFHSISSSMESSLWRPPFVSQRNHRKSSFVGTNTAWKRRCIVTTNYLCCLLSFRWMTWNAACLFPFSTPFGPKEYLYLFKIRSIDAYPLYTGGHGWDYCFDQIEHFSVLLDVVCVWKYVQNIATLKFACR